MRSDDEQVNEIERLTELLEEQAEALGTAEARVRELEAENERLRARIDSEFTHDQLLHEVSSYRSGMMAAESSLATATALLERLRKWATCEPLTSHQRWERMAKELSNQPSAPKYKCFSCGFTTNYGRDVEEWQCPCGACVVSNHPAAQECRSPAEIDRASEWDMPAAPLPGWDNIERKTAAPTRTEAEESLLDRVKRIVADTTIVHDRGLRLTLCRELHVALDDRYGYHAKAQAEQRVLDAAAWGHEDMLRKVLKDHGYSAWVHMVATRELELRGLA